MTIQEIIKDTDFDSVMNVIVELDNKQAKNIEGYRKVYDLIPTIKAVADEMVIILWENEGYYNEPIKGVSGVFPNKPDKTFGLELTPWNIWCGMEVDSDKEPNEIIGRCLFEMTWFGFDEKTIQAKGEQFMNSAPTD